MSFARGPATARIGIPLDGIRVLVVGLEERRVVGRVEVKFQIKGGYIVKSKQVSKVVSLFVAFWVISTGLARAQDGCCE